MSVIIITSNGPEHHYVTNRLCEEVQGIKAILVCDPTPKRSAKAVLKKSPSLFIRKVLRALYLKVINDAADKQKDLEDVFGEKGKEFDQNALVKQVGKAKGDTLYNSVKILNPDIIVVYGTSVIPDRVLNLAQNIALNMHTGISPDYRGTACAFWPLVDNRLDMVGATVHECTSKLDGGEIFFKGASQLQKGDTVHKAFARAVVTGTAGYIEVLQKAQNGNLKGEAQDLSIGREYKGNDLALFAELQARANIAKL